MLRTFAHTIGLFIGSSTVSPHLSVDDLPFLSGVYRDGTINSYVSLLGVPELSTVAKSASSLTLGAAVTLSRLIEELQQLASSTGFRHFSDMAKHLLLVANTPVRNAGSWAGNLMLKYEHNDFPSDVFLLLAAAGGTLQIGE